jgi:response regulator RpfG family c-di-GMP phosphodiesterase
MAKGGEIVAIEDDLDDRQFMQAIVRDLGIENTIIWFDNTDEAFDYLLNTTKSIFIIFSDINLPGKNGLEFKRMIDNNPKLRKKSIPFVFYSTLADQKDVNDAYTQMTVQGFFKKGIDYEETKTMLKTIFDYWRISKHPNTQ